MKRIAKADWKSRLGTVLAILTLAMGTSVHGKTVRWEEEVPLNVGAVITVHREVVYSFQGAWANPMDIGRRPQPEEAIAFEWSGKKYRYAGEAAVMLLAISPGGVPVLVARAADNRWFQANGYPCTVPFYVQLVPDETGHQWAWPPAIEKWLHGLPANLLLSRPAPEEFKSRYSAQEREAIDRASASNIPSLRNIDPAYASRRCASGTRR